MSSVVLVRPSRSFRISLFTAALLAACIGNIFMFSRLSKWLDEHPTPLLPPVVQLSRTAPPRPAEDLPAQTEVPDSAPIPPPPLPSLMTTSTVQPDALRMSNMTGSMTDVAEIANAARPSLTGHAPLTGAVEEGQLDEPVHEITTVEPQFPARAQRQGVSDTVTVSFIVHENGSVSDLQLVSASHPELFREPSFESIRRSRFAPGQIGGHAAAARCTRTFHYVLPNR